MPFEKTYAAILAGGRGTRFWPLSRRLTPKQCLPITGKRTLIQTTVDRLSLKIDPQRILILTEPAQLDLMRSQLPELPPENVIAEPEAMGTAAAVALGAAHARLRDPQAVVAVFHADHWIGDDARFMDTVGFACTQAVDHDAVVTIGITPDRPDTGYGYIEREEQPSAREGDFKAFRAKRFVEKPELETAKEYVDSGRFFWNGGYFIWKAEVVFEEFHKYLPDIADGLDRWAKDPTEESLKEIYPGLTRTTIDKGIMEKSDRIWVVPGEFPWRDVGAWSAAAQSWQADARNNRVLGDDHIAYDSKNLIVYSPGKIVVSIGVEDIIAVDTEDALLLCRVDREGDIRQVVQELERRGLEKYL